MAGITLRDEARVNMTTKGQVFVPKALREQAGLTAGKPARVGLDLAGHLVVLPGDVRATETREQRRARLQAALEDISGKFHDGRSTDDKMREMRGDFLS